MAKVKLVHLSDLHVRNGTRLNEMSTVLDEFLENCRSINPDCILLTGDIYHQRSEPTERLVVADFLQHCAGIAETVIVKGNHDSPFDLDLFRKLRTTRPLHVFERPGEISIGNGNPPRAWLKVFAVPWFDKAHIVAQLPPDTPATLTDQTVIDIARKWLRAIGTQCHQAKDAGVIPVLAGHILIGGSVVSTGQTLIGTTVEFAPADLTALDAGYCALGHIHKAQDWGPRIAYAGSPIRQNYGEIEDKGFRLIEIEMKGTQYSKISNDFILLNKARRIELFEVDLSQVAEELIPQELWHHIQHWQAHSRDALVRVRYHIQPQARHIVSHEIIMRLLTEAGAPEVKVEPIIEHQTRARSVEVIEATGLFNKLQAYFGANQINIDAAQLKRVGDKVQLIEKEMAK